MATEKKIPEVRFAGFTGDWKTSTLGSLVNLENGFAFKGEYFQEEESDYIVVTPGNVNIGGGFQFGKGNNYNPEGKFPEKAILKPGEIFLTMTDLTPTAQTLGFPAIVPNDGKTYLHNQRLGKLINIHCDINFLFQLLCRSSYQNQVVRSSSGTTVKHTSPERILKTSISYPKETEQKQLSLFFDNLDKLLENHQTQLTKLKNLKKAMLTKMFPQDGESVPEIRFKGFNGEWESFQLGNVGNTFSGLSGKTKEDFGKGNARYIPYTNIFNNEITDKNQLEKVEIDDTQHSVKYGDILFTTSSETPEEVGMSSVWMENDENIYLNSFCFGYRFKIKVDSHYMAYYMRSQYFRENMKILAQGISRFNISKKKVMEIDILLPDGNEQFKIGQYFTNLDKLILGHKAQFKKLNNIKKACLSKLFVA